MKDLIERQAAIEQLKKHRKVFYKNHMEFTILSDKDKARVDEIDNAIATLVNLPSAQPERKKGEWLPQDHNKRTGYVTTTVYYYPKCSECGHTGNYGMNYCPSCGADMRGKQDG